MIYDSFNLDKEITKVDPIKALTSGEITKDYIGRTVYLSNSATSCQEWIIIDTNHDGTNGTVDLFSKYILNDTEKEKTYGTMTASSVAFDSGNPYYNDYATTHENVGTLKYHLNQIVYNGFGTNLKNAMSIIHIPSEPNRAIDVYIKPPSLRELGFKSVSPHDALDTGVVYPYFDVVQEGYNYSGNEVFSVKFPTLQQWNRDYWTRTGTPDYYNGRRTRLYVIYKNSSGNYVPSVYDAANASAYAVGIIRFGKK